MGFFKGRALKKLSYCEDDFACRFDNQEESFSYKEVWFKKFCPENVNEAPANAAEKKLNTIQWLMAVIIDCCILELRISFYWQMSLLLNQELSCPTAGKWSGKFHCDVHSTL